MSAGTLFVVSTPLGNLGDLTERARDTLRSVGVVAAEDTRRTRTLLSHIGARPRLVSFHAHSTRSRLQQVIDLLAGGTSVALVTDAGTPTISDPGALLVAEARGAGVPVVVIPGASAVTAALSISGLAGDRYIFLGFPPRRGPERQRVLDTAAASRITVVMFESPQRLIDLLEDLGAICDRERTVAVARELTKVHEEVQAGTLTDVAAHYRAHAPRGEVTVVLSADATAETPQASVDRAEEIRERAKALLEGGASRRDVAHIVAKELHLPRNEAYRLVTAL